MITTIAWLDLETTDSDEGQRHSAIIEFGVVFTDMKFEPIMATQGVVNPALDPSYRKYVNEYDLFEEMTVEETLDGIFQHMDPVVQAMHTKNGLWDEVRQSVLSQEGADEALLVLYQNLVPEGRIALAGSGVGHFDSRYLKRFFPRSTERLTHWTYDVGVVRRFLRDLAGVDVAAADPNGLSSGDAKTHRALDDAWAHLREARTYTDAFRGLVIG
jgi:oligoribonuclease (3'-5' exoribonuclease)